MRNWFFHPLVFYPLVLILAAAVVLFSLRPLDWAKEPAPQAGEINEGVLVLRGEDFDAPSGSPDQEFNVRRTAFGQAQTLTIAVLPNMPPPTPAERGVRILLAPEAAALLDNKPVFVDVSYRPLPVNNAPQLAVSLQGISPAEWVIQPLTEQAGVLRFELPAQFALEAIGLRAISTETDQNYGLEILEIRVTPR